MKYLSILLVLLCNLAYSQTVSLMYNGTNFQREVGASIAFTQYNDAIVGGLSLSLSTVSQDIDNLNIKGKTGYGLTFSFVGKQLGSLNIGVNVTPFNFYPTAQDRYHLKFNEEYYKEVITAPSISYTFKGVVSIGATYYMTPRSQFITTNVKLSIPIINFQRNNYKHYLP